MGIYGRDYMRDEPPGRQLSLRGQPLTIQLIVANVAIFVLWVIAARNPGLRDFMNDHFMVCADGVLHHFRIHTLVTSAFSHKEPMHLLFNMLFLYWFGSDVEAIYGKKDFLLLYLSAGVVASLAHVGLNMVRESQDVPALGASGAIMGIVIVFACFYPNRRVYFYWFIPMTVRWLAIIYVALDLVGIIGQNGDHVAHAAHLGGAITGYFFYKFDLRLFTRLQRREPPAPFHLRDHHEALDSKSAARVDALLEKIALHGKDSLSESEQRFLIEASRHYRS